LDRYEKVMELAKRRGFLWPSFEIYGGVSGFYDYGPLGANVKKRVEDRWREYYVVREGLSETSSPTVGIEDVFKASGHVSSFVDLMLTCKKCGESFKAEEIENATCPKCKRPLEEGGEFNLMFKTHIGPGIQKVGYLRPETAQNIFILFPQLYRFHRKKLPFGVVQIGKAYRNEISPRQGVLRLREFTQAEAEVFVLPEQKKHADLERYAKREYRLVPQDGKETCISLANAVKGGIIANELLAYHIALIEEFLVEVGIPEEKLRFRQHLEHERAHYAADCWDAEVETARFGWVEVVGVADRTDHDLKSHSSESSTDLSAYVLYEKPREVEALVLKPNMAGLGKRFKARANEIKAAILDLGEAEKKALLEEGQIEIDVKGEKLELDNTLVEVERKREKATGERIIPHVIEPSYGIDRIVYAILEWAYTEEGDRTYMKLKSRVAPFDVAIFPLLTKEDLIGKATEVCNILKGEHLLCVQDDTGSIGRRYARVDEIGVPYAVTIDFDTLKDKTVTLRERDSARQIRRPISELPGLLIDLNKGRASFSELE